MRRFALCVVALFAAVPFSSSIAQTSFTATAKDPFDLCVGLEKRLPKQASEVRTLLTPDKADVVAGTCADKPCEMHTLQGRDFNVKLVVDPSNGEAVPFTAFITSVRWRLLTPLRVGADIGSVEQYFGIKRTTDSAKIVIEGVCSRLTLDYKDKIIQAMRLDCHACL